MSDERILIVDDDQIIRDSLSEFLRLEGYDCQGAKGFNEALSELEKQRYNLVLTDVNMPDVTGFDVLKHATENCPDLSVVLITGYGQIEAAVDLNAPVTIIRFAQWLRDNPEPPRFVWQLDDRKYEASPKRVSLSLSSDPALAKRQLARTIGQRIK